MGPFFSRFARLLFFFAAIAVVYLPGLSGVFILDDIPVFSHINSIQNFNDFVEYIVSGQAGPIGRPLSMASFAANFLVAGEVSPIAFKSVNLFLHLLTGGAIYLLCCELFRLFEGRPSNNWALLITVLWLFSSIHTSTVYYAVQRMTILASLFSVLAIWTYIKCRQTMLKGKAGSAYFIASVLLVFLAAVSKENGVLVLGLFFILELVVFGFKKQHHIHYGVLGFYCFLLLSFAILSILYGDVWGPAILNYESKSFTLIERILTQPRILWAYWFEILVPSGVDVGLYHDDIVLSTSLFEPLTTIISILSWGAVLVAVCICFWRKSYSLQAFGLSIFFVGHLLESTIVPLELYFEHRNYFPSIGVWLFLVSMVRHFVFRKRPITKGLFASATAYVFIQSFIIYQEGVVWRNPEMRVTEAIRKHPNSIRANTEMAQLMTFSGNTEKAQVVFDRIDSIDPGSTVVTQIQRLWSYCVSRGLPPQDAYRLKIVPVLGRQSLEYSTAWLYLMSEIQNEGCQVVDGHTLIESLEKELQQQITYYGNAKNLWDSIYPLLVLTGVENGLSEEIKKARYYYRRNSFHSGFYLIERLIEQGDAVRANSTLRGMVGEMNDHVKAYYSKDINRLEHNIFQLGKRNE